MQIMGRSGPLSISKPAFGLRLAHSAFVGHASPVPTSMLRELRSAKHSSGVSIGTPCALIVPNSQNIADAILCAPSDGRPGNELDGDMGITVAEQALLGLISRVVKAEVNGRPVRQDEVLGMTTLLFFGGLDTVASMLSFVARFLARNASHRRQLIDDPKLIPGAIEEFLRRHGLSNTVRILNEDAELGGVQLKKDDIIMVPISLHGMDERRFPDALSLDFKRKPVHATFGNGPHRCPGSNLARTEVRVFLEEWLKRIPEFEITPGEQSRTATGAVNTVTYLPLSWPVDGSM
jgi:hypothetical protein